MGLLSVLHRKQLAGDKVFTIEITPPKNIDSIAKTVEILDILKDMDLHGLAITNNTGGSFKLNPLDILVYIRRMLGSIPCIVHITSRDEGSVRSIYEHLFKMDLSGVSDILVLRGDPTPGHSKATDAYKYPTAEMVRIIHEYKSGRLVDGSQNSHPRHVDIFVAGHPEYPERALDKHLAYQKQKLDQGAQGIITNVITEPTRYGRYVDRARECGIQVPIIPSVIPLTNFRRCRFIEDQIKVKISEEIKARLEYASREEGQKFGIEVSSRIADELIRLGAPAVNFNVVFKNDALAVREILRHVRGYATVEKKFHAEVDYFDQIRDLLSG